MSSDRKRKSNDSQANSSKKSKSSASNSSSEHSASINDGNDGDDNQNDHLVDEEDDEVEYVWKKIPYTGEKYVFTLLFFVSKAFR